MTEGKLQDWMHTEKCVIKGLLENKNYFRRVLNNLTPELFIDKFGALVVKIIKKYYSKYGNIPSYDIIIKNVNSSEKLTEGDKKTIIEHIQDARKMDINPISQEEWLFDTTRDYTKEKAMFNFISKNAKSFYESNKVDYNAAYKEMTDIVSVNWDDDLGVIYSDPTSLNQVFDILGDANERIPIGIPDLDNLIDGGLIRKCLCVVSGTANLGKTLVLMNFALNCMRKKMNVVYLTLEIPREQIILRFSSAFTDLSVKNLVKMRHEVIDKIKTEYAQGNTGEFIVHNYPPSSITALDVDSYLANIVLKKNIKPDLIVIDYLGIMKPINPESSKNSYEKGKEVCENLRWLSYKYNCPVLSAAQNGRQSYGNATVGMNDVSDSLGIAMTADVMIGLTRPDDLKENNQIRAQIIKSRISKDGGTCVFNIDYDTLKIDTRSNFNPEVQEERDAEEEEKLFQTRGKIEKLDENHNVRGLKVKGDSDG